MLNCSLSLLLVYFNKQVKLVSELLTLHKEENLSQPWEFILKSTFPSSHIKLAKIVRCYHLCCCNFQSSDLQNRFKHVYFSSFRFPILHIFKFKPSPKQVLIFRLLSPKINYYWLLCHNISTWPDKIVLLSYIISKGLFASEIPTKNDEVDIVEIELCRKPFR